MTAQTVILRGKQKCIQLLSQPKFRRGALVGLYAGAGFFLSGGALALEPQPLVLGLAASLSGWRCAVTAVGGMAGYLCFWGERGLQGLAWALLGGLTGLLLGDRPITQRIPLLIPALASLEVAASGLVFLLLGWEDTALGVYLLRITAGVGTAAVFTQILRRSSPVADWLGLGIAVLALAQAAPLPWLNFGCIAGAIVALRSAFPAAALAGVALALSGITDAALTEVLCGIYLLRLIPGLPLWAMRLTPGAVYLLGAALTGQWDVNPLPGLILGGLLSAGFPQQPRLYTRRGETGGAQVKLELMAAVMTRLQQQLLQVEPPPLDEEALLVRTRERACGSCPNRKKCAAADMPLPTALLRKPLFDSTVLPFPCRKPGRMILELRRAQERYRNVRADRERCREYRLASAQQYGFLAGYLRSQADSLPRRDSRKKLRYELDTGHATWSKAEENGDRWASFYAGNGYHYILLCDGMGTGIGAADAARTAVGILQQLLTAGVPPEEALRLVNNLLTLQGRPGAVTVDLAQISLSTGYANVYKWGAAESLLLSGERAEKIGTAGPPPGIGVEDAHMTVQRLSLRGGEVLILVSDGVDREKAFASEIRRDLPPGELAAKLLQRGGGSGDDATVIAARLRALALVNIIPSKMRKCCRNTRYGMENP